MLPKDETMYRWSSNSSRHLVTVDLGSDMLVTDNEGVLLPFLGTIYSFIACAAKCLENSAREVKIGRR